MTDGLIRSVTLGSTVTQAVFPMPLPTPLLDLYPNASFAYSLRKIRNAYAGSAVRIRRSSDNAEADIGFSGASFDAPAAAAHISGGTGFIVTWYDQSGNALDLTQATAGNQPTYSAAGLKSLPTVTFNGTSNYLSKSFALSASGGTVFSVLIQTGSHSDNTLFFADGEWGSHPTFGDVIYWDLNTGSGRLSVVQPGGWDDNPHVLELYRDSVNLQGIVVDGASLTTTTQAASISGTKTYAIGAHHADATPQYFFQGQISELIFWSTDLASSGRTGARSEINGYYSVF